MNQKINFIGLEIHDIDTKILPKKINLLADPLFYMGQKLFSPVENCFKTACSLNLMTSEKLSFREPTVNLRPERFVANLKIKNSLQLKLSRSFLLFPQLSSIKIQNLRAIKMSDFLNNFQTKQKCFLKVLQMLNLSYTNYIAVIRFWLIKQAS